MSEGPHGRGSCGPVSWPGPGVAVCPPLMEGQPAALNGSDIGVARREAQYSPRVPLDVRINRGAHHVRPLSVGSRPSDASPCADPGGQAPPSRPKHWPVRPGGSTKRRSLGRWTSRPSADEWTIAGARREVLGSGRAGGVAAAGNGDRGGSAYERPHRNQREPPPGGRQDVTLPFADLSWRILIVPRGVPPTCTGGTPVGSSWLVPMRCAAHRGLVTTRRRARRRLWLCRRQWWRTG